MKIISIVGTRPEIIRLSVIFKKLDKFFDHKIIHTGQNFTRELNEIFFEELNLREPDFNLNIVEPNFSSQIGQILKKTEKILESEKPDKLLILGDTNSGLTAIIAQRLQIPVYHLEAGNRCFDNRVPEESNRRIIDHSSDILMPYTNRSKENLVHEGFKKSKIFVIGNPITEVLNTNEKQINSSKILSKMKVKKNKYFLVTLHRAENVDSKKRLKIFIDSFLKLSGDYNMPFIISAHPRLVHRINDLNYDFDKNKLIFATPFSLFEFIKLEKNSFCVLTDSGTVQEECCIFNIPNVTIRDVTERPETLEAGSNIISGCSIESIVDSVNIAVNTSTSWSSPIDYKIENTSDIVVKILQSKIPK
jgi:UDP-N-acetylglucosamine 2-epimerase (non-hydrolysing)